MVGLAGLPRLLRELAQSYTSEIDELMFDLEGGAITIEIWQQRFGDLILAHHFEAFYLGVPADEPEDSLFSDVLLDNILGRVRSDLGPLDKFAQTIQAADEWQAGWNARAESYAGGIKESYAAGTATRSGRVLPLPAMPAEGTLCHRNCMCQWEIQKLDGDGNYDCYWQRNYNDSCQTCIQRAQEWSPLRIRNGAVQL